MPVEANERSGSILAFRGITLGDVAMAAFVLCAISGVFLTATFDNREGARSIGEWMLANPGAVFLRNVHYWTAQVFLVFTALHIWDHLRIGTERRVGRGPWWRLVVSLPVIAFLMLSGFLLRADADAQQARLILEEIITMVPLAGPLIATFLFGAGAEDLQVVYVQHAATATIIVWVVIVEHARRMWPRAATVAVVGGLTAAIALVLSPGLHDGLDPAVKGPWYFLGLQEILHWTPWPVVVLAACAMALFLIWTLPKQTEGRGLARSKAVLLWSGVLYVVLCSVGLFLRAENWSLRPNWPTGPGDLRPGLIVGTASVAADHIPSPVPMVFGRAEGCLVCHGGIKGFSPAHQPEAVGCASCHLGDVLTLNKERAHAGMVLVPGHLVDAARTCGQSGCHGAIVPRVERSIMTTFAGVISANRRVFGEPSDSHAPPPHVRDLGTSAADSHLRQLCASCHLGQPKTEWGPITQESRGGGCNACHLRYSPEASEALNRYEASPLGKRDAAPAVHPQLTVHADNSHCFGCHSRSSRISTSYEGWHELRDTPKPDELAADDPAKPKWRQLDDGRTFERVIPDVHHDRGLDCIDCHTAIEVMGAGVTVAHKTEQVRVRCEDCHAPRLASVAVADIDPESRTILALRRWEVAADSRVGTTAGGDVLLNVTVDADGRGQLRRKGVGTMAALRAPLSVCSEGAGHDRLTCSSCHTAWAPRCTSCHTSFDPSEEGFDHLTQRSTGGAWIESSGSFEAALPTLGVQVRTGDGGAGTKEVVDTFVPGMILTIDRNQRPGGAPDTIFQRLYARTFAHTIRREARSCASCHGDPVALGFGRGVLRFEPTGAVGRWEFAAEHESLPADGLPGDAWVGFLQARDGMVSTRGDVRPFSVAEQQRILTVGTCLTCHAGDSAMMRNSVRDFPSLLERRSPECVIPVWDQRVMP